MADEQKQQDPTKTAKGFADEFVQTLGLLDLILGSIGLYWIWIFYGSAITPHFPSTNIVFVDVGLLAFGASLIGKLIYLLISSLMAIIEVIIEKWDLLNYHSRLEKSLMEYCTLTGKKQPPEKFDFYELSLDYITQADVNQRILFERIRTKSTIAYSSSFLIILYALYLHNVKAPNFIFYSVIMGAIVFWILGFIEHLDYIRTLSSKLIAFLPVQSDSKDKGEET